MWLTVILGLALVWSASIVSGATWYVERDGSGDFTTIQPAVDAAAAGDTIRIGPGRFDEGQIITNAGWSEFVRVFVTKENLTFIGAGDEETIIGQAELWDLSQGRHKGFVAYPPWMSEGVTIRDLRLENMGDAIYTEELSKTVYSGCAFVRNHHSIILLGGASSIINECRFLDNARDEMVVYSSYQDSVVVRNCSITLDDETQWHQTHMNISGTACAIVESCQFYNGATGLGVSSGARATIRDCLFDGQSTTGVYHGAGSAVVEIEGCTFKNQEVALYQIHQGGFWHVEQVSFEDVNRASLAFHVLGEGSIRDCDLARGERYVVEGLHYKGDSPVQRFDMTSNYWGTDNADSIAAWIYDADDADELNVIIDYEPFLSESVSTEQRTHGGLRRMYR